MPSRRVCGCATLAWQGSAALLVILVLFCPALPAVGETLTHPTEAQTAAQKQPSATGGEGLRVFLVTVAPGEAVVSRFGHSAIWVHDPENASDVAYSYGASTLTRILSRLLQARALAWLGGSDVFSMVAKYRDEGRSVRVQELNLTPAQKLDLRDFLTTSQRERAYFRYDFFRDNCSTGARDILDGVLGGTIRSATAGVPSSETYRSLATRIAAPDPVFLFALNVAMGRPVDRPISVWEEMFIPEMLRKRLQEVRVERPDSGQVPLVLAEALWLPGESERAAPATPAGWPTYLLVGVSLGAGMFVPATRRSAELLQLLSYTLMCCWLLVVGLGGTAAAVLWIFTEQYAAYHNENLLQMNPAALLLGLLAVSSGPAATRSVTLLRCGALAVAGLALSGLMLKLHPAFDQANGEIIALALPAHLGMAGGLWRRAADPGAARSTAVVR